MEDEKKNRILNLSPINGLAVVLEVIFLVFVGVTFADILKEPVVSRDIVINNNIDQADFAGSELNESLYNTMLLNSVNMNNIGLDGVFFREGSLKEVNFEKAGFTYSSFIVDIPSMQQSYRIYHEQLDRDDNVREYDIKPAEVVMVTCLYSNDDIIYDDYKCMDEYSQDMGSDIVAEYLRYTDFDGFYAYIGEDDVDMKTINIVSSKYEYTDAESAEYVKDVRGFVESLGISADLFDYKVMPKPTMELDTPIYVY